MASAKVALSKASEAIQHEHEELMQRLSNLDRALESITCYSEVYADLSGVQCAIETGNWLASWLPAHFLREEETALASVARRGPEMAAFVREIKREHQEIGKRVAAFCKMSEAMASAADIQQSICDLKQNGKDLASFMAAHMGAEERKLSSLS